MKRALLIQKVNPCKQSIYWNNLIALGVLLFAELLYVYWSTISSLFLFWWGSSTYGYGILIMPISFYLVWKKRIEVCRSEIQSSNFGLLLLIAISGLWWIAKIGDVQILQGTAFIIMIPVLALTLCGYKAVKVIGFPLGYLLIAIPLWGILQPIFQNITLVVVTNALRFIDVSVFMEDHSISIPEGRFFVEESCAGLRYFLAMLAFSLLYSYLNFTNYLKSAIYIFVALSISLVVNWIRVFSVIIAGHISDMKSTLIHDHETLGWILFVFALIPLIWFGVFLQKQNYRFEFSLNKNENMDKEDQNRIYSINIVTIISASLIIFIMPLSAQNVIESNSQKVAVKNIVMPVGNGSWVGPLYQINPVKPEYSEADYEATAAYRIQSNGVNLYIAYYSWQQQGKKIIQENNVSYDDSVWGKYGGRLHTIVSSSGAEYTVNEIEIRSNTGQKQLLWQWYYAGRLFTPNRYIARLSPIADSLGYSKGAASIIMSTENNLGRNDSRQRLEKFFNEVLLGSNQNPDDIIGSLIVSSTQ